MVYVEWKAMKHYKLDHFPISEDVKPIFVNDPELVDASLRSVDRQHDKTKCENDQLHSENLRVYVPLDINRDTILRRIDYIIGRYGEVNEVNEYYFYEDVMQVVSQIELYNQVRTEQQKSEKDIIVLVREIISKLNKIPVVGTCRFPNNVINLLDDDYLNTLKKFCENPVFWFAS